jgi:uncharacterized protein (TIGR04206 family)
LAWVRSEYAGELAVLSAFFSGLLPWSVSYTAGEGISTVDVRFPFFLFKYVYGIVRRNLFVPVLRAPAFPPPEAAAIRQAYTVWLAAAAVVALALLLAVAYYAAEERVEDGPVDPVRLMGGLLTLTGAGFAAATAVLLMEYGGLTVPIGALIVPALGIVLLRVDRA